MRSECGAPLQEVPELKRMTLGTSRHMRKSHGAGGIDSRIKTSGMSRIPNAIAPGPHPIKPLRAMLAYDRLIHADQGARHGLPDHYRTTATSFSTEAFGATSALTEFSVCHPSYPSGHRRPRAAVDAETLQDDTATSKDSIDALCGINSRLYSFVLIRPKGSTMSTGTWGWS